jgi:hypothetical protein
MEMLVRTDVVDAARSPGVAAQDPPCREHCSLHRAMLLQRTYSVSGARWVIGAHVAVQRRDHLAIRRHESQGQIAWNQRDAANQVLRMESGLAEGIGRQRAHGDTGRTSRAMQRCTSACNSAKDAVADAGRARMTTSVPFGTSGSNSAHTAFSRRRTVLRITAVPTCLLMMNPNRASRSLSSPMSTEVTRRPPPHRAPRRTTKR